MHVEEGSMADWRALAGFHYRSHRVPAPRKIFVLKRGQELCGVIVYSYPAVTSFGRRLVVSKMGMKELNGKLSNISRVVVHPKYRTMGLGSKLIKDTLGLAGTEYVEMSAVMAKYNPFAERAGMKRILTQPPPKEAQNIVRILERLGFNIQLLGSKTYVVSKLQTLTENEVLRIREVFVKQRHTRFMKSFSYHLPFGTKDAYAKEIMVADLNKLANLIKICGFLMQTKVYLAWKRSDQAPERSKLQ
jgi:GNAT superfamily N-acetyltransferase